MYRGLRFARNSRSFTTTTTEKVERPFYTSPYFIIGGLGAAFVGYYFYKTSSVDEMKEAGKKQVATLHKEVDKQKANSNEPLAERAKGAVNTAIDKTSEMAHNAKQEIEKRKNQ